MLPNGKLGFDISPAQILNGGKHKSIAIDNMQSVTPQSNLEKLVQALTEFFSRVDFVKVVYLFGSTVRGEANCLSDIDIAVLYLNLFAE